MLDANVAGYHGSALYAQCRCSVLSMGLSGSTMLPLIAFYFIAGVALIAVCNWIDG